MTSRIRAIATLLATFVLFIGCTDHLPISPSDDLTEGIIFTDIFGQTGRVIAIAPDKSTRTLWDGVLMARPQQGWLVYGRGTVGDINGGAYAATIDGQISVRVSGSVDKIAPYSIVISPTGQHALYATADSASKSILYLVDVAGASASFLTANFAAGTTPVFSPDGAKIACYIHLPGDSSDIGHVAVIDTAGNLDVVVDDAWLFADGTSSLDWSQSTEAGVRASVGGRIAFVGVLNREGIEIFTISPDGGNRRAITDGPGFERGPVWSPSGRELAFISGSNRLTVCDRDARRFTTLTTTTDVDRFPEWSSNGRYLLYTAFAEGLNGTLHVVDRFSLRNTVMAESAYRGFWVH